MFMRTVHQIILLTLALACASAGLIPPSLLFADTVAVTHSQFQAIDAQGVQTWTSDDSDRVILTGIILNAPEQILDPAPAYDPAPADMGGKWQIFIQSDDPADHAGTAVWIGQNYYSLPFVQDPCESYTDDQWHAELCRINRDPNTGYLFQPGDKVRVEGAFLPYKGKNNINERHSKDTANNFLITLIEPAAGLPRPELITLADLKDPADDFIFDPTRQTGCEYYQARRVRINDVRFVNPAAWGPDPSESGSTMTITDGSRTFPVKLGIGAGITADSNNLDPCSFDIIAILDQENDTFNAPYDSGYRLWVPDYDGNGLVLTHRGPARGNLPADIDRNGAVDLHDYILLVRQWLALAPGIGDCPQ